MRVTPTESAPSMTPPPAGRADAYPHAADLALIPFAMGPDRGVRALRAHARPHPPRRRAVRRYRRGRRGDDDGGGDAARRGVGRHPVRRAGAHRRTHRPRRARARGGKAHRAGARRREGRRPDHLHRAGRDRHIPRPHGLTGQYDDMPRVTPPEHSAAAPSGCGPVGAGRASVSTATSSSARRPSRSPRPRRWRCGRGSRVPGAP